MLPFISKRMKTIDAPKLHHEVWQKIPLTARKKIFKVFSIVPEKAIQGLKEIDSIKPKSLVHLFRRLAKSPDPRIAIPAIDLIGGYGTKKDLPFIDKLMYSHVPEISHHAIHAMAYCNEAESLGYLKERLKHADIRTRKACIKAISHLKPRDYELYAELSEIEKFRDPSKSIVRRGQIKDGSTTTLLGGKLYDKAIIRGGWFNVYKKGEKIFIINGIKVSAFEAWKKAFETDWKKKGLKHNPIEPILKKNNKYRVYKNNDGTLRISAGVIRGTSLGMFFRNVIKDRKDGMKIAEEIKRQKTIIDSTLVELKIKHSHDHPSNYVVEFEKNKPKLYIIDFDAAFIQKD